jgi:ribosomal protein S18 acetylase RimI-like enzyme
MDATPLTEADREVVERLYGDMYEALGVPPPPPGWIDAVCGEALAGGRHLWLARVGGETVGFVDFKVMPYFPGSPRRFAHIFDLYVAPAHQRQGHGAALARRAVAAAVEEGADGVELNVLPHNARGLAFWRSLGFEIHLYALRRPL